MQLVRDLRYVLNKSLKEMPKRKEGRFMFFLAFSLIFGIISLFLIYAISTIVGYITLDRSIDLFEILYVQKWFWIIIAGLISPMYLIFILKYFETTKKGKNRVYRLGDLFRSIDAKTFWFFLFSLVGLTLLYTFFFFKDLGLDGVHDSTVENLLNLMGEDGMYSVHKWLDSLVFFIFKVLPLLIIIFFGMTLRGDFSWRTVWTNRRSFLTFVLLYFVLLEVDAMLWDLADGLIIQLIGIPFVQNAIPIFFGLLVRLLLTIVFIALLSYFAYYSLQLTKENKTLKSANKPERPDLLDDII